MVPLMRTSLIIILVLLIRPQGFAGLGRATEGGKA